jgi:hypothetical protein
LAQLQLLKKNEHINQLTTLRTMQGASQKHTEEQDRIGWFIKAFALPIAVWGSDFVMECVGEAGRVLLGPPCGILFKMGIEYRHLFIPGWGQVVEVLLIQALTKKIIETSWAFVVSQRAKTSSSSS